MDAMKTGTDTLFILLGAIMVGADSDFQRQTYGYQQEVVRMVQ